MREKSVYLIEIMTFLHIRLGHLNNLIIMKNFRTKSHSQPKFFPSLLLVKQPKCTDRQFQCKSGECVPVKYTCDGEFDCKDRSDEDPTECSDKRKLIIQLMMKI